MNDSTLFDERQRDAATAYGIVPEYYDLFGKLRQISPATRDAILDEMGHAPGAPPPTSPVIVLRAGAVSPAPGRGVLSLAEGGEVRVEERFPRNLPVGYHRFHPDGGASESFVIVRPDACYLPDGLQVWGWAVPLYAARSRQSWGIGDLADLARLARWSAEQGAGMMLLNPLCAADPVVPQQPSPYYPTSRCFSNPLYINIAEVPGAADADVEWEPLAAAGRALNEKRLIDRDEVFRLKREALEKVWRRTNQQRFLEAARIRHGPLLSTFATFCALAERWGGDWRTWRDEYRRADSAAVARFAVEQAERVHFHEWLQAILDEQMTRAAVELPLVHDLPIGFDPGGADAWAWQDSLALGAAVGAPPDLFNPNGQNWGLPPFIPHRLQSCGYLPLIESLRATFRHAGGVRIDHVMGLFRLYWIPAGHGADEGAYVRYPSDELLAILAVESYRARAWVAGEDLGTVEPGVRERLAQENILSHRLLWFENDPPAAFPWRSFAAVTTHDLPTVAGLWSGADLAAEREIGLHIDERRYDEVRHRVSRLTGLPENAAIEDVLVQLHRALGQAPSAVVVGALTDALAVRERPNMPGTVHEWPNWSMALPAPVEDFVDGPLCREIAAQLRNR